MDLGDEHAMSEGTVKKIMYVNRKAPYGTIYALESLEVVLIAAAFDQDVSLVFMDDGVYQLKKGHQTKGIEGTVSGLEVLHLDALGLWPFFS